MKSVCSFLSLYLMTFVPRHAYAAENGADTFFGTVNGYMADVLFYNVLPEAYGNMPFIVGWLIVGAVYLTVRFGFINVRMMGHAFDTSTAECHMGRKVGDPFATHAHQWKNFFPSGYHMFNQQLIRL